MAIEDTDTFIVERNGEPYQVRSTGMSELLDTDLFLVSREGVSYKIPASEMNFGGPENPLEPSLPPFGGLTTTQTNLLSPDGKILFSTNGIDYSTSIDLPIDTFYYVDWGTDILSAEQGSKYEAGIEVSFPNLSIDNSVLFEIKSIDKLPDPFGFDPYVDVLGQTQYTSNTISPLETINAPTPIWVTSDAVSFQIRVGYGPWFDPPAIPGTAYVSPLEEIQVRHTTGSGSATTYTTTVNIGYGTEAGEFEAGDFNTTTSSVVYDIPTLTPGDNATIDRNGQVFTLSTPTGTNIHHEATDWQFASDASFTDILNESLNDSTNLLSYTLSGISENQTVYARARFIDSSGTLSPYAESDNLTAVSFYNWRYQIKIQGGEGGKSTGSNRGGYGGVGYMLLESLVTSANPPAGTIERYDGSYGQDQDDRNDPNNGAGDGAFGINGGQVNGYCYSGGGGGAGAVKLNDEYLAGVGGGGGASWGQDGTSNDRRGGLGASLPSANGAEGYGNLGGGTKNGAGGVSSSTPSNGGMGVAEGSGAGGGGGGFAGGGGGTFNSSVDRSGGSGGGGGSWNQTINYVSGNWKLTAAGPDNLMNASNNVAEYRSLSTDPDNWDLVGQSDQDGVVNLATYK